MFGYTSPVAGARHFARSARRRALGFARQEAFPAKYRAPLRRLERNRGFPTALRAGGHGLAFGKTAATRALAFALTRLAALGLVFEIFIVEEVLLSRGKDKFRSAIYALEGSILKLRHGQYPRHQPEQLVRIYDGGADGPAIGLFHFPA